MHGHTVSVKLLVLTAMSRHSKLDKFCFLTDLVILVDLGGKYLVCMVSNVILKKVGFHDCAQTDNGM